MRVNIAIPWTRCPTSGEIKTDSGHLVGASFRQGVGTFSGGMFSCKQGMPCRMELVIDADNLAFSSGSTTVFCRRCRV